MTSRKKQDWTPEKVMKELRAKGTTINQVALQYGCSRQGLYQSLRRPNHRGELRIAHALGVHPMSIWPTRYKSDGTPQRTPFELKPIPANSTPHSKGSGFTVNGNLMVVA